MEHVFKDVEERMQKAVNVFKSEISKLRTGRASPQILDGIRVEYYGQKVPLKQVATINAPEPNLLVVQAWDKTVVPEIDREIKKSGLGLNPRVEGNVIKIPIPPMSEERRQELLKIVKKFAEDTRVAIRNIRRDGMDKLKKMEKDKEISEDDKKKGEEKIQKLTDKYIDEVAKIVKDKEKEILEE